MINTSMLATDVACTVLGGIEAKSRAFDPDGVLFATAGPILGFNGQPRDHFTGNYLLGNGRRMYSPVLMRFISADRQSPFANGGINAYAYCQGDPVNRVDPGGEVSFYSLAKTVVWLGSRANAAMSAPGKLKLIFEGGKLGGKLSGLMAFFELPGASTLASISSIAVLGSKAVMVSTALYDKLGRRYKQVTQTAANVLISHRSGSARGGSGKNAGRFSFSAGSLSEAVTPTEVSAQSSTIRSK